jgi:hypothetical protein
MALTLGQGAQMVADPGYLARVRDAMVRAAIAVAREQIGSFSQNAWATRRQMARRILQGPDSMVACFLAAVAADYAASLTWYQPTLIASSTNANPIAVTCSAVHGLTSGDIVEVAGHAVNTNANGVWTATVTSTTAFTVPTFGNGVGGATGSAMKMETDVTLNFTVANVFGDIAGIAAGD